MDIGNFKYFFFDEKVSIQNVETPSGEYLIEVYNPSVKDINGVMFLSGKHFKNKIKHNGGNIYIYSTW